MKRLALIAIGAAALTGCASDTTKIESAYVSPETYANYDCQQIGAEFSRLSRKAEELGAVVDKMAADDQAQAFVGVVLFWPALFFLEGGETQQTQEYARLKGQMEALEKASVAQGCGADIRHVAAAAGSGGSVGSSSTSSKLASLKMLYRDGAITEAEYIERRKALVDEQAQRELEMMERQKAIKAQQQASASQTATSDDGKLKVAVLPFATSAGTSYAANDLAQFSRVVVKGEPALSLVYEYDDRDLVSVERVNSEAVWSSGGALKKPNQDRVFTYLTELDADIGITYFYKRRAGWYSADLYYVEIYIFDAASKTQHKRDADERSFKKATRELLRSVARDRGVILKN